MFFTASSPNLKTRVITFVNAHTISHYLQTSVLSLNRTLYIECCSEISINLVFTSHCYFASIFYSIAYVFLYNQFLFIYILLHFILCRMCVCHMFNKVLTYLLTYLLTVDALVCWKCYISPNISNFGYKEASPIFTMHGAVVAFLRFWHRIHRCLHLLSYTYITSSELLYKMSRTYETRPDASA